MKKLIKNKKSRKGFTLVELVVVILIIAILAAATFLGGATVIKQSRFTKAESDLRLYAQYAQDALYENPQWATDTKATLVNPAASLNNKYLTSDMAFTGSVASLKDGWGNAYNGEFVYKAASGDTGTTDCAFIFSSNGADATAAKTYAYDDVISGGSITFKPDTFTSTNDDLVTVVYLNSAGEVSIQSYNAGK